MLKKRTINDEIPNLSRPLTIREKGEKGDKGDKGNEGPPGVCLCQASKQLEDFKIILEEETYKNNFQEQRLLSLEMKIKRLEDRR